MLGLPQRAEDGFLEVPTGASEIHDAFLTGELVGDEPRQLANPQNVT